MHRPVVIVERLEIEADARLLRHQFIGPGADRILHEAALPDVLIVFRRDDPAGTAHIRRSHQDGEIEERRLEIEFYHIGADDLHAVGLILDNLAPRPAIVLIAPFDILRRHRGAVVKFDTWPQVKRRALRVLGEIEFVGERQMIPFLLAEVLDQPVMQGIEEVVGGRGAVVLLRVEPARRDVGVPGEHHLARGRGVHRRPGAAHERRRKRRRRKRRAQDATPRQHRLSHFLLPGRIIPFLIIHPRGAVQMAARRRL